MRFAKVFWIASFLLALFPVAYAADQQNADFFISPWRLGMNREQVIAEKEFGPYKPVQFTDGVETFDAQFDGKKTNVSFVFDDIGTLSHIQVWKYEGPDFDKASEAAAEIFDLFTDRFGGAQIFGVNDSKILDKKSFISAVSATLGHAPQLFEKVENEKKVIGAMTLDVMPKDQPGNCHLHSQLVYSGRHKTFYILLFQDVPNAPSRQASGMIEYEVQR